MLDLFSGELGWSRTFAARGHDCVAVDLTEPSNIPTFVAPGHIEFIQCDVRDLTPEWMRLGKFDAVCASSPCEGFSVWGMRHFFPNPKWPDLAIELFSYTRDILNRQPAPYVMENVRAAQQFVGLADAHCGPYYLWGSLVPNVLPKGLTKGFDHAQRRSQSERRKSLPALIPTELANCVCDYAERLVNPLHGHGVPVVRQATSAARPSVLDSHRFK